MGLRVMRWHHFCMTKASPNPTTRVLRTEEITGVGVCVPMGVRACACARVRVRVCVCVNVHLPILQSHYWGLSDTQLVLENKTVIHSTRPTIRFQFQTLGQLWLHILLYESLKTIRGHLVVCKACKRSILSKQCFENNRVKVKARAYFTKKRKMNSHSQESATGFRNWEQMQEAG